MASLPLPARRLAQRLLLATALAGLSAPALADRALVIGIDSYADAAIGAPAGGSSAKDVAAIQGLLTGSLGYTPDNIRVLQDGAAGRDGILAAVDEWLIKGTQPGERAFLYFSGLGYFTADTDGDEGDQLDEALVPADAKANGADIAGLITDDELNGLIDQLAGRQVAVVVDAGYSGIVTANGEAADATQLRAPRLGGRTRAIVVEPRVQQQKAEGVALDTDRLSGDVIVYSAASGGQAALFTDVGGVFTTAFVEALSGAGDANANGTIANAEVLSYVRGKSETGCAAVAACTLGLTPTAGPAGAIGGSLILVAAAPGEPASPGPAPEGAKLTAEFVLDYFGKGNTEGVVITQNPVSPVPLGTRDIRFTITSPVEGSLILLDLSDDGTLVQLFPNEFSRKEGREGVVLAQSPLTVPDAYYGISFDATAPSHGTLIALVTTGPVEMPSTVRTRSITVIPREEATEEFLPAIAETLNAPVQTGDVTAATVSADWSVATLRYAIE